MPFARRFLHYSPGPTDLVGEISSRAVLGAWFELLRQGGDGAGELTLCDDFSDRGGIDTGDWIAFEYDAGDRWYLGRVEEVLPSSPAGVTLRLQGMGGQLCEVFPGGFGSGADGAPPHRYAYTDLFSGDPDYSIETLDTVSEPTELVRLLMQQYVEPNTDITYDANLVEEPDVPGLVRSFKFRGEEPVRDVLCELALISKGASWGVDEDGKFFFLKPRTTVAATFQEGVDVISLAESRERDLLYNRLLLTGGYVYDCGQSSGSFACGTYRWRGTYIQPASRDAYGERQISVVVPWIRTVEDSREFAREFFRTYAEPTVRYLIEVGDQPVPLKPWEGRVRLLDAAGNELIETQIEAVRVLFDHAPRFRLELGPADPHGCWPEPPVRQRWVIGAAPVGELITFSGSSGSGSFSSAGSGSSSDLITSASG